MAGESNQTTGVAQRPAVGIDSQPARAAKDGYQPDDQQKLVIKRVSERVNWMTREAARWALERQIFETVAFYAGIQWIEYNQSTRRWARWNAPSWFPTPVSDHFSPRVDLMAAALLRPKPQGRVRANSNEARDREAAKVAESMVSHIYDVTHEDELRQQAAFMAALGGTVIAEDYWNPQAGKLLRIPRMQQVEEPVLEPSAQCPTCDIQVDKGMQGLPCPNCRQPMQPGMRPQTNPDGSPATQTSWQPVTNPLTGEPMVDAIREGEMQSRVRMLFNFYWDPKASTLDDAQWCGEALYTDLNWLDQNYPEFGPYVAAESGIDGASFYESSILALIGPSIQGAAYYGGQSYLQGGAVLRKYQEKPSAQFPRGLQAIVANNVCLYMGDLPIKDENGDPTGEFSYTEFRYGYIPGRFPGNTPAEKMVLLQRRINGIDSQIILNRKTLLNPWILAPKGSGLNPGQVAMRPAATILYNTVGVPNPPQVVQGTPLPNQIMDERQQAVQCMDELAKDAASAANAQIPGGMKSGISMYFLKEQMDELGLPRLERWGQWIARRDRKRLLLAQQHYREPRAIKIIGQGSDYQVRYWSGADLAGNIDVSIDPGSLIPRSKSIKTQVIFDAIDAHLIDPTNQMQRQRIIEALDLPEFDTEIGPDIRRAQKENALMDDGQLIMVNTWDDHQVHETEHLMRIKDPSFDSLSPVAKRVHLRHYEAHKSADAEAQQADQAQQLQQATQQAQLEADSRAASRGMVAPTITNIPSDTTSPEPGQPPGATPPPPPDQGGGVASPPDQGQSVGA